MNNVHRTFQTLLLAALIPATSSCRTTQQTGWTPLFPEEGVPPGWSARHWADVGQPAKDVSKPWRVEKGVLLGIEPRGAWLVSDREYGDFILEFEWKIGERGNSGVGLRFPSSGDPAFDGIEVQMVDPRYFTPEVWAKTIPAELTGGIYRAIAPTKQLFRPLEWNRYRIECRGATIKVELNGEIVQRVDLNRESKVILRHDNKPAPALKDRPRRGRIGFQELSRSGRVEIRHARIQTLESR
ncbi:MAG: DUF1080 domain-containing protein [Verrucomicrobia bacterium]|nr:DUF1080 domain-containing protein [Verrucomicrobiota bacterium]